MTNPDYVDWRCGILDLLEAAALRRSSVEIRLDGQWRRVTVIDVPSEQGEDWLLTTSGERIPVLAIDAARPRSGGQRNC